MKYARTINNAAVDVVDGDPSLLFHPSIASQFVSVPNEVESGWLLNTETEEWSAPEVFPSPEPQPTVPPTVSAIAFMRLFTREERVKARELRATDEKINDFWAQLEDVRVTEVVMALPSIQEDIEYTLTAINAAGVLIDVQQRKAKILSGKPF